MSRQIRLIYRGWWLAQPLQWARSCRMTSLRGIGSGLWLIRIQHLPWTTVAHPSTDMRGRFGHSFSVLTVTIFTGMRGA